MSSSKLEVTQQSAGAGEVFLEGRGRGRAGGGGAGGVSSTEETQEPRKMKKTISNHFSIKKRKSNVQLLFSLLLVTKAKRL